MSKYFFLLIFFYLSLGLTFDASALIVGSNTVVSIISFTSFPEIDILFDNEILAFGWMKNGFDLENSDTVLSFQSIYPVSGTVDFNGGEVTLESDLIFSTGITLNGLGDIIGQGHIVKFASNITSWPADTNSFQDVQIITEANNLTINSEVTFIGDNILSGQAITLDPTGAIIVDSDSRLCIRDLDIFGIKDNNIRCADNTASLILDNVNWVQDDSFTFDQGSITFEETVNFSGTSTFIYESTQTSTIASHSSLILDTNFTFSYVPSSQSNELIDLEDNTASLILRDAILYSGLGGLKLTKGKLRIRGNSIYAGEVQKFSYGAEENVGLILGDDSELLDCDLVIEGGAQFTIAKGSLNYRNKGSSAFIFGNSTSLLELVQDTRLRVYQNLVALKGNIILERGAQINKFNGSNLTASVVVQ